ncbi:MAG: alpha/beta hydrolase [Thermoleophilaceae bacterium]
MPAARRPTGPGRGRRSAVRHALLLALAIACAVAVLPAGSAAVDSDPDGGDGDAGEESAPPARRPRPRVIRDIPYLRSGGPTLDVHRPPAAGRRAPAVLLVHGGAWSGGDKAALQNAARTIAAAGFVAVNVNYTLATPGRPGFPVQVDQLRAAVHWVRRRARPLGVDPTRVGALGSSAGAHLVSLLATIGRGPLTRGARLRAVAAWSPPVDLATLRRHHLQGKIAGFLGCRVCLRRTAAASPIAHVTADDPPMMIVNSRWEMIPASQARRMSARLRAAGVRRQLWMLPGIVHAPRYSPMVLGPTIRFLRRHLG